MSRSQIVLPWLASYPLPTPLRAPSPKGWHKRTTKHTWNCSRASVEQMACYSWIQLTLFELIYFSTLMPQHSNHTSGKKKLKITKFLTLFSSHNPLGFPQLTFKVSAVTNTLRGRVEHRHTGGWRKGKSALLIFVKVVGWGSVWGGVVWEESVAFLARGMARQRQQHWGSARIGASYCRPAVTGCILFPNAWFLSRCTWALHTKKL